jgi:hypothetical protein
MNVSLSPINELGRVLHKFTSTAYEVAEFSYNNLLKFNIVDNIYPTTKLNLWKTYNLSDYKYSEDETNFNNDIIIFANLDIQINFSGDGLISFIAQDMMPGTILAIYPKSTKKGIEIIIGATGSYSYPDDGLIIDHIIIYNNLNLLKQVGSLHCYYNSINYNIDSFDSLTETSLISVPIKQFIGVSPGVVNFVQNPSAGENVYSVGLY